MKRILLLLALIANTIGLYCQTTYYISPSGNDANSNAQAQNIATPWRTITKGWSVLVAGDTLYCRGGTYNMTGSQSLSSKSGTSGNMIHVLNYQAESPVFDWGGVAPTSQVRCFNFSSVNYVHFRGLRITNISQSSAQAGYNYGWSMNSSDNNNLIERIEVDHIGGSGIQIGANCTNNIALNCDSHHNDDPLSPNGAHENSNGFEIAINVAGNTNSYIGCRAWYNGDDGFDGFNGTGALIFQNCWSFWNGFIPGTFTTAGNGQGFKCGQTPTNFTSVKRTFTNCIAYRNRQMGFDQNFADNSHTFQCVLYNNTAYLNGNVGFYFGSTAINQIKNNISFGSTGGGGQAGAIGAQSVQSNNSWSTTAPTYSVSAADFVSVSDVGIDGPRQADGSLPNITFLHLASGSELIDRGVNVGLPFIGTAPDVGAFEYTGSTGNVLPVADAGTDRTVTYPAISVTISGATATDADGTISSIAWTKVVGGAATITGGTTITPTFSGLSPGTYQFQLFVVDNSGGSSLDQMQVTVTGATNTSPTSNAGPDQTITLPVSSVNLTGNGTDAEGAVTYLWTKASGPGLPVITSPTSKNTAVTGLQQGVYQYQLKVTDAGALTATDQVQITVNSAAPPSNISPTANAGIDQTVTYPATITLTGSGTDVDGTIATYAWIKISGPSAYSIASPSSASTAVEGLSVGTYQFQFTVTDNNGATGTDVVIITVNPIVIPPAYHPPISNAGTDITVYLPKTSCQMNGLAADYDGSVTLIWTQVSGPNIAVIQTPNVVYTTISGLIKGVYRFRQCVTDNTNNTVCDDVIVTVKNCSFWDRVFGRCK